MHKLIVEKHEAGRRLDSFLSARLHLTRGEVHRLLDSRGVRVAGRVAAKGKTLHAGDEVEVEQALRDEELVVESQADLPLTVLAEGADWVVIDKPPGMPVHPLRAGETDTVLNAAMARWPLMRGVGEGGLRSGVVHRLDVNTSGALLLARTQEAWQRFRRAFAEHRARKVYRAIVEGKLKGTGREELWLTVAQHRPAKVRVVLPPTRCREKDIRLCRLSWRALAELHRATLVEVELKTGFLHQIRATFSHLGHPVVGDELYGAKLAAPRQMLHAAKLEIAEVQAASPDPPDFAKVLAELRQR